MNITQYNTGISIIIIFSLRLIVVLYNVYIHKGFYNKTWNIAELNSDFLRIMYNGDRGELSNLDKIYWKYRRSPEH